MATPQSIYKTATYGYLINYNTNSYGLFIVVPLNAGQKAVFPDASTITMVGNSIEIMVEIVSDAASAGGYAPKSYQSLPLSNVFNPAIAEIKLISKSYDRATNWNLYFEFADADPIGALSAIEIEDDTALNCPYVYLHGYSESALLNRHYPRMLVARKGYDYAAVLADEKPTDATGVTAHIRKVHLNANSAATPYVWLSPTYLNDAAHYYYDGVVSGFYIGETNFDNANPKKKGKIKNNRHPVQPGIILGGSATATKPPKPIKKSGRVIKRLYE